MKQVDRQVNKEGNRLLTAEEVSERYLLKLSRVRHLVFTKEIPFVKIGKSVRFLEQDLDLWIQAMKCEVRK